MKMGLAKVGARFKVSAQKVLRLAQASDDLPGQFPSMVRGRLPTSMSAGSPPALASP